MRASACDRSPLCSTTQLRENRGRIYETSPRDAISPRSEIRFPQSDSKPDERTVARPQEAGSGSLRNGRRSDLPENWRSTNLETSLPSNRNRRYVKRTRRSKRYLSKFLSPSPFNRKIRRKLISHCYAAILSYTHVRRINQKKLHYEFGQQARFRTEGIFAIN